MAKSFSTLKDKMSAEAQKAIKDRKHQLITQALLHEIREHLGITQEEMADRLGMKQANVSRTQRRRDLKLSTLKRHVEAMGGELDIVAKFPTDEIHLNISDI